MAKGEDSSLISRSYAGVSNEESRAVSNTCVFCMHASMVRIRDHRYPPEVNEGLL